MSAPTAVPRSIDEVLAGARSRLHRVSPERAFLELGPGALLVDIRPEAQRRVEGEVPGSLLLERNVLEWRVDPRSGARIAEAGRYDLRVLVLCSEGCTSSLAGAALHDLGLTSATDVVGGVQARAALGLPLVPGGTPASGRVPPGPRAGVPPRRG